MHFDALRLETAHLAAQRAFYTETLGLPLAREGATEFTVRAGTTRLTFVEDPGADATGAHHFAFNVPRSQFASARGWIAARVPLLREGERDAFASTTGGWDAEMLYFRDAAGNVLEFVARRTLPDDPAAAFAPDYVRCVSEIGLPVADVPAQSAALAAALGAAPYGEQSDTFAPVGDEHGLVIVVRNGRPWFPTRTPATTAPAHLTVRGDAVCDYRVPGTAFTVALTPRA